MSDQLKLKKKKNTEDAVSLIILQPKLFSQLMAIFLVSPLRVVLDFVFYTTRSYFDWLTNRRWCGQLPAAVVVGVHFCDQREREQTRETTGKRKGQKPKKAWQSLLLKGASILFSPASRRSVSYYSLVQQLCAPTCLPTISNVTYLHQRSLYYHPCCGSAACWKIYDVALLEFSFHNFFANFVRKLMRAKRDFASVSL